MIKKKRELNLILFCILLLAIFVSEAEILFAYEEEINLKSNVRYDSNILEQFKNNTKVNIFFRLNNFSEASSILSNFSEDEIKNVIERNISNLIGLEITEKGFNKLINDKRVNVIYYNFPVQATLSESAPLINATQIWNLNYNGTGEKICVIDTGVNASHPDLSSKIIDEYCYCSAPEGALGHCCEGGISYGDSAEDNNGHGTHVTGIIASQDATYKGVAYGSSIYIVKVLNSTKNGYMLDIASAIDWCKNQGVDVISISIGNGKEYGSNGKDGTCPTYLDTNINNAVQNNISLIIASGNEGYINGTSYPGCSPNAIEVGSSTKTDLLNVFTNRDDRLDILAPGYEIWSLRWNSASCLADCSCSGDYMRCSGTSQATPHIAGIVALLLERDPTLTPGEIKNILKNETNISLYDYYSPSSGLSYPRVNAFQAFNSLCTCTNWTIGACGTGGCLSQENPYTRACNPVNCSIQSKCQYNSSCPTSGGGGGASSIITVCASGCNYTSIQTAIDNSDVNDKVYIKDNRSYNEYIKMNSTTSEWLICENNSRIYGFGGEGIRLDGVDAPTIIGCILDGFDYGIYLNSSYGLMQNNTILNSVEAIRGWKLISGNKIRYSNITGSSTYGIYFYTNSWNDRSVANKIEHNLLTDNGNKEIYIRYGGDSNNIQNNTISGSASYGIHIADNGVSSASIYDNIISNNGEGVYMQTLNNILNNNIFCPSNVNVDIHDTGSGSGGSNNTCEKPGSWSDTGTTGCTYYCDTPAEVNLIYPNNNSTYITQENITLVCESEDNLQLGNITLYHNLSGTWQANQTANISGTSNITIFNLINVPNATSFIWNCLVYDNHSRGGFSSENWSVSVIVDKIPPNVNILSPLNQTYNVSSIYFNVSISEDGNCEYSLDNGVTNNSMTIIDSKNFSAINSSMINGSYLVNFYCEDSIGNLNYTEEVNFNVNALVLPNDTYKFSIKNSTNNIVAWLGNLGNIVLKGNCFFGGTCDAPGNNSLIIRNSTNNNVAFINSTGDLCLVNGNCSDNYVSCSNPGNNSFIIRNSSNTNVIFINSSGSLCLRGELYENSNP